MVPDIVKEFLVEHKEKQGCFCFCLNDALNITQFYGDPTIFGSQPIYINSSIFDILPVVLTETFDVNFEIPFYNLNKDVVCNIYFLKHFETSYLILVDKSEIFEITQKYQQFAHDDNISKNKYKRLAEELEKAKHKLKQSNQEKATLIAMLSHELGAPLTSILGYSELMLSANNINKKNLEIINKNANYLKHLIENTLLFGQSEATNIKTQIEPVSVQSLFNILEATILPTAKDKNLNLKILNTSDKVIYIDITRTKQILINLLNNAVKYTVTGVIQISFEELNNNYIFLIQDTGLGIPKHLQESIFNPWERIEENDEKGSGIGLFISQKLARAIGGELILKESNPGSGSIFQLSIPVQNNIEPDSNNAAIYTNKLTNKSILIIDDDVDILNLIEALLYSSGITVYTADNYPVAESILASNSIDLVLTDFNLGTIKASSFVNKIKNNHNDLPVLLMTSMPSNSIKARYLAYGFNDIVTKPLTSDSLLTSIVKNI